MNKLSQKKAKEEHRMFKNPILEFLSLSGPKMMTAFHLILASCILFFGTRIYSDVTVTTILLLFVCGVLTWSLTEYLMHRFVFHIKSNNKAIKAFHYAMHGYHHAVPHDTNRLFMPPVPAFLFLALFFGLFYIFLGKLTWFFLPGFEIGYLFYSRMHYLMHIRVPKNKYLKKMWHHHAVHHYNEENKGFGVSSDIWDRIFNTMPSSKTGN